MGSVTQYPFCTFISFTCKIGNARNDLTFQKFSAALRGAHTLERLPRLIQTEPHTPTNGAGQQERTKTGKSGFSITGKHSRKEPPHGQNSQRSRPDKTAEQVRARSGSPALERLAGQSSPRAAEPRPSALHITTAEKPAPRFGAAVTFCRAPCNDSAEQATKKPCGVRGLSMIRKNAQTRNWDRMCRNLYKICKNLKFFCIFAN